MNFLLKGCANFMEVNMSFLKLNGGTCVTLVVLAMLMASSKIALADTTNLICQMNDNKFWVAEGPATIALNEAQGAVVLNFPKVHGAPGSGITGGSVGGGSFGPYKATFSADTITYSDTQGTTCTINRLTGVYSCGAFLNGKFYNSAISYTCNAAQKKF